MIVNICLLSCYRDFTGYKILLHIYLCYRSSPATLPRLTYGGSSGILSSADVESSGSSGGPCADVTDISGWSARLGPAEDTVSSGDDEHCEW